ncbi:MAG TPA: ThiF family adenylyltransferase [Burkholderiaceae bacterium]|jgi:shikimate dehydrogenase
MLPPTLSGKTRLVPILAHPVDHVRAPRTYNPAFAAAGLDWVMVAMGVHPDDLAATLAALARVGNLQGVNLTIPHKAAAHRLCTRLTAEARSTGMANTIRLEADGSWAGANSDGIGFLGAARAHGLLDVAKPVVIAGAGGAGTAIAFSLAAAGVREIDVFDSDPARADALQRALQAGFPGLHAGTRRDAALRGAGLAVNATPLGLHDGEPSAFDAALLPPGAALFDIVAARDTELMAAAQARGLRVLGGRAMVEHQVAHQIAFWRRDAAIALETASTPGR